MTDTSRHFFLYRGIERHWKRYRNLFCFTMKTRFMSPDDLFQGRWDDLGFKSYLLSWQNYLPGNFLRKGVLSVLGHCLYSWIKLDLHLPKAFWILGLSHLHYHLKSIWMSLYVSKKEFILYFQQAHHTRLHSLFSSLFPAFLFSSPNDCCAKI